MAINIYFPIFDRNEWVYRIRAYYSVSRLNEVQIFRSKFISLWAQLECKIYFISDLFLFQMIYLLSARFSFQIYFAFGPIDNESFCGIRPLHSYLTQVYFIQSGNAIYQLRN
ncbi:MAG: hypothetical protein DRR16_12845 [Candidatus Parabeggiatoa sp. nov. 3]|nr:MAG: hypothetical protein DRR00_18525 [Gammaproteobacteria bacterium]RKZ64826.1 MAG: hypothetical protein DRQ99_14530 [Gammaproteobacteria bacterium]RKZ85131.1 MAG: hypothetical protein DRR16_12845 [Gammaproteobacteria bacterium]